MIDTLIVPGLGGSGPGHWQRLWVADASGAEIVEQQEWDHPDLPGWLHQLQARLSAAPGAVLVAHSLGCALVAHLARCPAASHVAGALLVAPADVTPLSERDAALAPFDPPLEPLPFRSIVVASRNDPFMNFSKARDWADAWGSGFVDLGHAGHVNVDSGFGRWRDGRVLADGLGRGAPDRHERVDWLGADPSFSGSNGAGLGVL